MTDPIHSGMCEKCYTEYEVWGFHEYGTSRLCRECDVELKSLNRVGLPEYTKPLDTREDEVIELLTTEKCVDSWESEWRIYLYWE